MFKFITLTFICLIVFAGMVDATKLQNKADLKVKTQAKALVEAYERLQETMDAMEETGEKSDFDWNSIGAGFNKGISNLKRMFHFWGNSYDQTWSLLT